ncbi:MAG TPA: hypothetical protein PKH92_06465 [Anaerolineaceae bacterium]|nr:hypothetical protein [Anaerolineaceae bacterium]HNZ14196.1 hypothetical protein [Anaerolineaceae bacterium]HOD04674.1 hypothetical protein [Anaerolineaceae bacterium]HOG80318.1 hypothetical protein [Anaerolineaceae bacterium]HQF61584.1 hypothetical protein [Anaerolineaceae bacterium]
MTITPTRFLTLSEASRRYGIDWKQLQQLIATGTIRAAEIRGEVIVNESEVRAQIQRREDLPEYRQFGHLSGVAIWIGEASRKYNVPHPTLSRWKDKGLIKILGQESNKILLDEQDVAYCAYIYHQDGGQGKRIFADDGRPYINKPR